MQTTKLTVQRATYKFASDSRWIICNTIKKITVKNILLEVTHLLLTYVSLQTQFKIKEVTLLNPNYDNYDQVYNHKFLEKLVCFIKLYGCSTKPLPSYLVNATGVNLLLIEREGSAGEYWPEVVAVRTERSEICQKRPRANIPQYGSS